MLRSFETAHLPRGRYELSGARHRPP